MRILVTSSGGRSRRRKGGGKELELELELDIGEVFGGLERIIYFSNWSIYICCINV